MRTIILFFLGCLGIPFLSQGDTTNGVPTTIVAAEYFIDSDPGLGGGIPLDSGAFGSADLILNANITLPANITMGYHSVSVRMKSDLGVWSTVQTRLFSISGTPIITAAEYFFDADPGEGSGTPIVSSDGFFGSSVGLLEKADVDSSALGVGPHYFCLRAKDNENRWGVARQYYFEVIRPPTGIARAEYQIGTNYNGNGTWTPMQLTEVDGALSTNWVLFAETNTTLLPKGLQQVWVRATDNYGRITLTPPSVQFEVVNWPPVMQISADQMARLGTALNYQVLATDPDGTNQTLRYSLGAGAPAGAAIDPQTGVFTWTPVGNPSTNIIKVQVNDGTSPNSRDIGSFTVFVEPASGGDGPAVLSASGISESGKIGVRLSKPVDAASANLRDNYLVNGMKPDSAELQPA